MQLIWANLSALMVDRWGKVNINRLAKEAKVGVATVQRIKDGKTSIGVDVLVKIAKVFSIPVWQLVYPGLRPSQPPLVIDKPAEQEAARALLAAAEKLAEYKIDDG